MRTMMWAALALVAGCDTSQAIRQNGLIPRPRPDTYDGQPLAGPVQFEGHAESTLVQAPHGSDDTNGATVARTEFGAALRWAVGPSTDLGLLFDYALASGGTVTGPNPISPPTDNAFGLGVAVRHSLPLGDPGDAEGLRLGVASTMSIWTVPRREDGGFTGTDGAPVFTLSLVPSKRFGTTTLFGGVGLATQIRVPATYVAATGNAQSTDPASANGPVAGVFSAGARIDVSDNLALVLQASMTANAQGGDVPMLGGTLVIGQNFVHRRPLLPPPPPPTLYGPPPWTPTPYGAPPPYPPAPAPAPYPPAPPPS